MHRMTVCAILLAAVTAAGAGAQQPPTPPTPPTPPARPLPAPRPAPSRVPLSVDVVAPTAPMAVQVPLMLDAHRYEEILDAARAGIEAAQANRAVAADAAERARSEVERALGENWRSQVDEARIQAREALEAVRPALAPLAPLALHESLDWSVHRPIKLQGAPEDSLYRLAREVLNRGDYGRAAQMFKDIAQKYPKSVYADDLAYYEAWARYKIGTTAELRTAARLLEPRASKLQPQTGTNAVYIASTRRRSASDKDVAALYTRINSVLASRGDREAADRVAKLAKAGANTCDREDMQVRVEAINALTQMDPAGSLPIIRGVLDKTDDCSVELRRNAIFILGRRGDADAATLIAQTAKTDPSRSVRAEAINWLPKLQGETGISTLEEMLRSETDASVQRSIVRALVSSDNPRARASMRSLIDRTDAPTSLRVSAINSLGGENATAEDAAYLRAAYGRTDNDQIRNAIINTLARIGGTDNEQWVLSIASNPNQPSEARSTAISRLTRFNIAIGQLTKLYDVTDNYNVRRQLVSVLGNRKEPEATDKLIDIVKNGTVTSIRTQAIQALRRKNDPRATQLLQDFIDGKARTP